MKARELEDGDRFVVYFNDPEKARRAGYLWSTSAEMTESEVRSRFREDRILAAARAAYANKPSNP